MDVHKRLRQLLDDRNWTEYRLAKKSGLSESTLTNIFHRNTTPNIHTLKTICAAFDITLSQFFAENEMIELNADLKELFDNWLSLTPEQRDAVLQMMRTLNNK